MLDQRDCEQGIYRGQCKLQRSAGACIDGWETATLNDLLALAWELAMRDGVSVEAIHAEFSLIKEYAECPFLERS